MFATQYCQVPVAAKNELKVFVIVVVFLFVFHSGQANSSVPPLSLSLQPLQPATAC